LEGIQSLLQSFSPVALHETGASLTVQRFDTKFLLNIKCLPALLQGLQPYFSVLEINGQRVHDYETLYFDTPDFKLYYDHHNDKPNRMKVRVRKYGSSGEVFFEIKHKLKGMRTGKLRLPQQKMMFEIGEEEWNLIRQTGKTIRGLERKLSTDFSRISLAGNNLDERITFDTSLLFHNATGQINFGNVMVMEVKHLQAKPSEAVRALVHQLHLVQHPFSKYAIGVALLESSVKHNLFKPTILQLKKIENG